MEQEFGNGWAEGVHPDDFDFCLQIYVSAFDKREPFEMDYRLKNKFGEYRWIRDFGRPFYDLDETFLGYIGSCYDITNNKEKELQLIEAKEKAEDSEEKFKTIFNMSQSLICIADINTSKFKFINPTFEKILGYRQEELLNKPFFDFIHPDDIKPTKEVVEKKLQAGIAVQTFENRYLCKNGNYCWLNWNSYPVPEKGVTYAIAHDITKLKKNEKELKEKNEEYEAINEEYKQTNEELFNAKNRLEESEKQLKRAQQTAKTGNWIWYIQENKLWWSDEMYNIFEIDKNTFTGKLDEVIEKAIHPEDKQAVEQSNYSVMVNNKPIPVEYRINTNGGQQKYVLGLADKITLDRNGKSKLLTGIVKDITDYKLTQKELIAAKEKAEESDRLKSAFLQNLSHEIRTPLNAICGFSGRLNKSNLSEEKRNSFVSIIQNSSNQLLSIISHVLTISALETNQEKVYIDKVCINNIIVDLLAIFKQQTVNQNISLYAKQPLNDKQSEIYTDKTKTTQILSNLISNAMKFTHEGFIEFGYNLKDNELEFYVKDSGIGIKVELQEKIFERFGQADLSINRKYGGTGLGLAISKGFTELLGGKIWVNSEIDKGSTFYFTIPYKPVNEVDKAKTDNSEKLVNKKPVILVAEDEEFNFLYIEELLIDFDYKLIHAKDGQETVDIFKTNPDISLILMDIKMPIMDGHTAAKLIKEIKPDLQIIAQSAYALEHEIEKYSGIFDDYLTKPITEDILIEKVNKYMINK
ncbi:MAG: PAS domain-containing protein [Bacteroidales bacterium]|nr:PAS domain-containing protein [Bacteroidales bacterium]